MARQSLIWTALPNGFTADRTGLRMSVMLSPRLDPQTPLGTEQARQRSFRTGRTGRKRWRPPASRSATTALRYRSRRQRSRGRIASTPASASPIRPCGRRCSKRRPRVKGFKYTDLSPSVLLSYDAVLMAERIENLYRDLARAAIDRMPRVTELIETERWRGFIGAVGALDKSSVDPDTGLRDPHKQFDALRRSWPRKIDELSPLSAVSHAAGGERRQAAGAHGRRTHRDPLARAPQDGPAEARRYKRDDRLP